MRSRTDINMISKFPSRKSLFPGNWIISLLSLSCDHCNSQVQANLKDVAFFVHKKQGYVQVTEQGTCDVFIGGRGISGTIHVRKTDHFQIVSVDIKVNLRISIVRRFSN
jgi:hypothetical protein